MAGVASVRSAIETGFLFRRGFCRIVLTRSAQSVLAALKRQNDAPTGLAMLEAARTTSLAAMRSAFLSLHAESDRTAGGGRALPRRHPDFVLARGGRNGAHEGDGAGRVGGGRSGEALDTGFPSRRTSIASRGAPPFGPGKPPYKADVGSAAYTSSSDGVTLRGKCNGSWDSGRRREDVKRIDTPHRHQFTQPDTWLIRH